MVPDSGPLNDKQAQDARAMIAVLQMRTERRDKEIERLEAKCVEWEGSWDYLAKQCKRLLAEGTRKDAAIKKYGRHLRVCDLLNPKPLGRTIKCTCGYDAVSGSQTAKDVCKHCKGTGLGKETIGCEWCGGTGQNCDPDDSILCPQGGDHSRKPNGNYFRVCKKCGYRHSGDLGVAAGERTDGCLTEN